MKSKLVIVCMILIAASGANAWLKSNDLAPKLPKVSIDNVNIDYSAIMKKGDFYVFFIDPSNEKSVKIFTEIIKQYNSELMSAVIVLPQSVDVKNIEKFNKTEFPVIVDSDGKIAMEYNVSSWPAYYKIKNNGRIAVSGTLDDSIYKVIPYKVNPSVQNDKVN